MQPVIAVDIDEVLARHNYALAKWYNQNYGTNHTEKDYFSEYWSEVWNIDRAEAERRAQEFHDAQLHGGMELVPGAQAALRQLAKTHRLEVVTVRRKSVIPSTQLWLETHFPKIFSDIHFIHFWDANSTTTKADICKQIGATHLIDDSLKHCTLAAEQGLGGILFGNYAWNQAKSLPTNVVRADSWQDALEVLYAR